MSARRWALAVKTGAVVAVVAALVGFAHFSCGVPIARAVLGVPVSDPGFVIQLAALVVGTATLAIVGAAARPHVLIAEGAICVLAWGAAGLVFLAVLVGLWSLLEATRFGRARFVMALVVIAAPAVCASIGGTIAIGALVFSVMFGMRLAVYSYERYQNDTAVSLVAFLVYILPAPLIVIPPYMAIVPRFGAFAADVSQPRLREAARHLALAGAFAAILAAHRYLVGTDVRPLAYPFVHLVAELLDFAALVHLVMAALLVHGLEVTPPIDRPALATSFLELWRRFGTHLRDAQLFLFYTPAILRLRRVNRYLAIVLATTWTMVIGNTVLHVAIRYCFLADPWPRIGWALVANGVMTIALACELCLGEWRRRRGVEPEVTAVRRVVGWAATMTLAATVFAL